MRLPMFFAGVVTIFVLPVLVSRYVGHSASIVFGFLLALSPMLIYFSRYARPYGISVLLTFVGIIAFFRWWAAGSGLWALLFTGCAALATYLHLTTAPAFVAPFIFAFGDLGWRCLQHRERRPISQLYALGITVAFFWVISLGPPLLQDWSSIAHRAGYRVVSWQTFSHSFPLLIGTSNTFLVAIAVGLAIAGAVVVIRRQPELAVYFLVIIVFVEIVVVTSRAAALHVPIVFIRYTLIVLPLLLLLIAVALVEIGQRLRSRFPLVPAPSIFVLWCAAVFLTGPLPRTVSVPNNWSNHALYQYSYDLSGPFSYAPDRRPLRVSEFYRILGRQSPGSLTIVEAPWYYEWHNNPFPFYQEIHGQHTRASLLGRLCAQPGTARLPPNEGRVRFRNIINVSDPSDVQTGNVDFIVIHKDLRAEMPKHASSVENVPPSNIPESVMEDCLAPYISIYGPPVFEDDDIVVLSVATPPAWPLPR